MKRSKHCVPPKLIGIIADSMPAPGAPGCRRQNRCHPSESFHGGDFHARTAAHQECTIQVRKTNNAPLSCISLLF
ncbi:hypothetical protein YQ44_21650 [Janthinobacterium sp. 1_2014MBL_MicDiv]|nr:hypothetical protein YQ44_21650 [Janthinobacterium sp. 1_2014MBL_MicDiv]